MQPELAQVVHAVMSRALRVREGLLRGETYDFQHEQATFKGLLGSELEARRWPDYGGDPPSADGLRPGSAASDDRFLGIRYALACWLDELFILDTPWSALWNERKMEEALYGINERAWKFWEQARRAEARPTPDALEVFYLCVMLGFRGDLRHDLEALRQWAQAAQTRISKSQAAEPRLPPELEPPTHVPPLRGRDQLRRAMLVAFSILAPTLVGLVAWLIARLG